jgi:hypothetical protein
MDFSPLKQRMTDDVGLFVIEIFFFYGKALSFEQKHLNSYMLFVNKF